MPSPLARLLRTASGPRLFIPPTAATGHRPSEPSLWDRWRSQEESAVMPILPLEPFLFPDDLLTRGDPLADAGTRWWALHTKPRVEKSLGRRLRTRQIAFFLPLYKHTWRRSGRNQVSHLPLFPSYVFLHGDAAARHRALETNMVVRVLPVLDQEQLHAELTRVYRLLS